MAPTTSERADSLKELRYSLRYLRWRNGRLAFFAGVAFAVGADRQLGVLDPAVDPYMEIVSHRNGSGRKNRGVLEEKGM